MTNYITKSINHHIPILFAGSLTGLTVLSGILLSASSSFAANTANLQTTVNVAAACSLTVSPSSHTATINPGTTGSIGTSTVKSICNDPAGLAVYAVGYTDDTYGNNKLTATIAGNTYDISSNYTSSGTPLSSEWYMTLTPTTGTYTPSITTGYDSAHIIPNVYTKVAYRNTMTDIGENATGAQFTAAFNAYISLAQPAGSYTGKVKFLLIHPNVLTYDSQTGEPDTTQPSTLACEPAEYDTFDSSVTHYLQDVSQWENQVALEQEVTAFDSRDGQAYKVKRLKMSADGCQTALWMSNLNLGAVAFASGVTELNSTNTNLASGVSAISAATFNSWVDSSGDESFTEPVVVPLTDSNSSTGSGTDSYGNKFGTLYNYAAATAGTYAYTSEEYEDDPVSDLCPAGWRMPTGEYTTGETAKLVTAYSLATDWRNTGVITMQQDLGFAFAGTFFTSAPYDQGSTGTYWTTSVNDEVGIYVLSATNYVISAPDSWSREYGFSLHCIAK